MRETATVAVGGQYARRDARLLRASVAAVWVATGVAVLHPHYRAIGEAYLEPLGLPAWVMWVTCAFEIALGAWVVKVRANRIDTLLQVGMVVTFTLILAVTEPMLMASPYGVLSKNLPLLAVLVTALLVATEGWSPRALWLLRGGVAMIWITEGIVPKILFQQAVELNVVAASGLVPFDPSLFLVILGVAQTVSGVLALVLRGRVLLWLLYCQAAALVVLPLLVSIQDPLLWVHPFGPMTKNIPIIVGTLMVARRCSSRS
ncbi:MAG: hypothetical protein JRH11_27435 [Deltaproteobacteria bacterium]|nr:hypothetical protein [Deltaproteobacteria bacterium]